MRLEGVGRRYGPPVRGRSPRRAPAPQGWVLHGIDLTVPQGALLRLCGANGSGKSTLLRLLAGVDTPTAGRISGRPSSAYVPERFPAALPLTARSYLTHLGRVRGLRRPAAQRAASDWLDRFGAGRYAATPMDQLSKGTSQKVALAQALLAEPGLLVLDEAWTGLDEPARGVLDRAVAERVADGGTVVFVDHDPRRLAGLPDATYQVSGGGLTPLPEPSAQPDDATATRVTPGPQVRIVAEGPPGVDGAALPEGLPAHTEAEHGPDGTVLLTAPAAASDAVLRTLLAARLPWHVRSVRELPTDPWGREGSTP